MAVLASLLLFVILAGLGFKLAGWGSRESGMSQVITELTAELLPAEASTEQIQQRLNRWSTQLKSNLAVFDSAGQLLASAGMPVRPPSTRARADALSGDIWHRGTMVMSLPGSRFLVGNDRQGHPGWLSHGGKGLASLLALLGLVGVAVAIVALPVARGVTRRLETLQKSVQAFGDGDLASRATIGGRDELARLASSFNESADHIQRLVAAQKSLLANASHELRSPLARIRMATELFSQSGQHSAQPAKEELLRNVGELDALVDEILLASRLDADSAAFNNNDAFSELDLGGLVAEEAARCALSPQVAAMTITADSKLLRRMIRNLLENALRYGGKTATGEAVRSDITVNLALADNGIEFTVCDRGPGVPLAERERIFEPFYRASGASERAGGVGLGLSLVRQIAQLHGGSVSCQPRTGGGSCFRVWLPGALRGTG